MSREIVNAIVMAVSVFCGGHWTSVNTHLFMTAY